MTEADDADALWVPLFEALDAIGFGEHASHHHFNTGTLFWSLTRLFGCYERVMSSIELPRDERPFLEADIEHYIVRFRIVLNDIAYVIWQLLPPNARNLKGPKGRTHPKNREMSVFALVKYLEGQRGKYPELAQAFTGASGWMTRLKNDRDNVVHYKSKIVIFEEDPLTFCFFNAAGPKRAASPPGDTGKLITESVAEFANSQMVALHGFMNTDLRLAVRDHAFRSEIKSVTIGWNQRIRCIGVRRFKSMNPIEEYPFNGPPPLAATA